MSYCTAAGGHPDHQRYHDGDYGFPIREDAALFERFALEINQAGLSWLTILKKQAAFQRAFAGFDLDRVAAFGEEDVSRLLQDAGIIRNRLKVRAVIENARRLVGIREQHGSFAAWLDRHHPRDKDGWQRLFKTTFVFTGGEIVGELLMSTGYLPGAHDLSCPIFPRVVAQKPPWLRAASGLPNFGWLIEGRLAGMARPQDAAALSLLRAAGIGAVLSLTERALPEDLVAGTGLHVAHVPIADLTAPTAAQAARAVEAIDRFLADGLAVAVHCAAGLGRTGTILASYLVRHGTPPEEAIATVRAWRPGSIETVAQEAAVVEHSARVRPPPRP